MNKPKFLIIGAGGLIGKAVTDELGPEYSWQGTYYKNIVPRFIKCDITDNDNLKRIFKQVKPTCVIHCAQLSGGLDYCQKYPSLARKFHYGGTINIGEECLKYNAKLIFISTECIFNGKKEFYVEEDSPAPRSLYGEYKARSEEWIRRNLKKYVIIRTISAYGWDPATQTPNAVMKLFFSSLNNKKTFVPVFRWTNPVYVKDLGKAIVELSVSGNNGIFHIGGPAYLSRFDWLKKTAAALNWKPELVVPKRSQSRLDRLRPLRIRLVSDKFSKTCKTRLHGIEEALNLLKRDVKNE